MLRLVRTAVGAVTIPAAALTLAACGSGGSDSGASGGAPDAYYPGKSAEQILDASRSAASEAKTVQIKGKVTLSGKTYDFGSKVRNGKGETDVVRFDGTTVKYRLIGKQAYLSFDQKFYQFLGPAIEKQLYPKYKGYWLKVDPNGLPGIAASFADIITLLESYPTAGSALTDTVPEKATFTRVAGKEIGGVKTTGITFSAPMPLDTAAAITAAGGEPPATLEGTVYVAAEGKAYPVAVKNNTGVDITLSGWTKPFTLANPPTGITVTLAQIGFGGL